MPMCGGSNKFKRADMCADIRFYLFAQLNERIYMVKCNGTTNHNNPKIEELAS